MHVHNSLPRRMLAACTGAALAEQWRMRLAIAWPPDTFLTLRYDELFDEPPGGNQTLVLHTFFTGLAPAERFERWEQPGGAMTSAPEQAAGRRPNPVRPPVGDRAVYIRAAGAIEASPPVDPNRVGACLRSLRVASEVAEMAERIRRARTSARGAPSLVEPVQNEDVGLGEVRARDGAGRQPPLIGMHVCASGEPGTSAISSTSAAASSALSALPTDGAEREGADVRRQQHTRALLSVADLEGVVASSSPPSVGAVVEATHTIQPRFAPLPLSSPIVAPPPLSARDGAAPKAKPTPNPKPNLNATLPTVTLREANLSYTQHEEPQPQPHASLPSLPQRLPPPPPPPQLQRAQELQPSSTPAAQLARCSVSTFATRQSSTVTDPLKDDLISAP